MVVIRMLLQMLGELTDTLRQNRDLNFRRTGVTLVGSIGSHNFGFFVFGNHCFSLSK